MRVQKFSADYIFVLLVKFLQRTFLRQMAEKKNMKISTCKYIVRHVKVNPFNVPTRPDIRHLYILKQR